MFFCFLGKPIMPSMNDELNKMRIDEVVLILTICEVAMQRHWDRKSEEEQEREFEEESWEPREVYLRQRDQRERWRGFSNSARRRTYFWIVIKGFISTIFNAEENMKPVKERLKEKCIRSQMLDELESVGALAENRLNLMRRRFDVEIQELEDRLSQLKRESKRAQQDMAELMFIKRLKFLRKIHKICLRKIKEEPHYHCCPFQRIFDVNYQY